MLDFRAHLADPTIARTLAGRQPAAGFGLLLHRPEHARRLRRALLRVARVALVATARCRLAGLFYASALRVRARSRCLVLVIKSFVEMCARTRPRTLGITQRGRSERCAMDAPKGSYSGRGRNNVQACRVSFG